MRVCFHRWLRAKAAWGLSRIGVGVGVKSASAAGKLASRVTTDRRINIVCITGPQLRVLPDHGYPWNELRCDSVATSITNPGRESTELLRKLFTTGRQSRRLLAMVKDVHKVDTPERRPIFQENERKRKSLPLPIAQPLPRYGWVKAPPSAPHRSPPVTSQSRGYVGSPAGAPPEPPRSTSDCRSEVLRGGSGGIRLWSASGWGE